MMAEGGQVSKAQLKRDLDTSGKDLYNIDLQIQKIHQGQQQGLHPNSRTSKTGNSETSCIKGTEADKTKCTDMGKKRKTID